MNPSDNTQPAFNPPQTPAQPPLSNNTNPSAPMPAPLPKKSHKKLWFGLGLLVVVAALAYALLGGKSTPPNNSQTTPPVVSGSPQPYLVIDDNIKDTVALDKASGQNYYTTPVSDNASFMAASPSGQVLLSFYNTAVKQTTYALLTNTGSKEVINSASAPLLKNINGPSLFLDENDLALSNCSLVTGSANNACKIISLNLTQGTQKTLYSADALAHVTGGSEFNILGLSSDKTTLYLGVQNNDASDNVLSLNISSGATKQLYQTPTLVSNMSLSPNDKTLLYDMQVGSGGTDETTNIVTIDLATGKQTNNFSWPGTTGTASLPYVWSPDNTKVLLVGNQLVAPTASDASDIGPLNTAYIDLSKNSLTNLQTIQDSAHNNIQRLYWLDNSNVIYGLDTSTTDHDFVDATTQIYKQNISTKQISKVITDPGALLQVVWF